MSQPIGRTSMEVLVAAAGIPHRPALTAAAQGDHGKGMTIVDAVADQGGQSR